jgi:hypothetical protein
MGACEKVKSEMVVSNPWVRGICPWFGVFSHGIWGVFPWYWELII